MFPIDQGALHLIALVSAGWAVFASFLIRRALSLALLVGLPLIPIAFWILDPPTGEYAGLAHLIVFVALGTAGIIGLVTAYTIYCLSSQPRKWVGILSVAALATSALVLQRQYVPAACAANGVPVVMAGQQLHVPLRLPGGMRVGNTYLSRNLETSKSSVARTCRLTRNGTQPVTITALAIYPAMATRLDPPLCEKDTPCPSYDASAWSIIRSIEITSDPRPAMPEHYWTSETMGRVRTGDLMRGTSCSPPPGVTQCHIWAPFGAGGMRTSETAYYVDALRNRPVEEVRTEIEATTRAILQSISAPAR